MKFIPNKLDYVSIILAVASFVAVKMLYADVFRGNKFWVNAGYLAAILGVLAVGGALYSQFKTNQIGLFTIMSATLVLYGFWLVKDASDPNTRFTVLKEAYIKQAQSNDLYESASYTSWDIKLDFFEGVGSEMLRKDKALIDSLSKGLTLTKRWSDLGRGLYYENYIDQTLICYASLIERGYSEKQIVESAYGNQIMNGVLFYELHKNYYFGDLPPKMQTLLASLPANPKGVFQKMALSQIQQADEMNLYELEMFLYFLTQFPTQLPEANMQKLFAVWKAQKPAYKQDIEELLAGRDKLKNWIRLQGISRQEILDVNFGLDLPPKIQEANLSKIKPFLHLLGHEFTIGEDIVLRIGRKSEHIVERTKSIYKDVQKTRQVTDRTKIGNTYTSNTRTEKYTESVYAGTESTDVYQRGLALSLVDGEELELLFSLTEFLPHQYFNPKKKLYDIPYQEMARSECWVLALPQSWYCSSCKDY
ncbi:MAG: hypothetical protein ACJAWV_004385 [Flammeovirgaceae bacterium]|jgi:hypothetical protein